jgi:hypothetical protein
MLAKSHIRIVLIPFVITLITITVCWIIDDSFIVHQFPVKMSPYPIWYMLNVANLLVMTVSCMTIFFNKYPVVSNNLLWSAAAWFSGHLICMGVPTICFFSKLNFSENVKPDIGQVVLLTFSLAPLITLTVEFIKFRRSLAAQPLHISS